MAGLSQTMNAGGVAAHIESKGGIPILIVELGYAGFIHIAGPGCGASANAECPVLEFVAVLNSPRGVSDETISRIDKKFELASVERVDASHVVVTDGMVLMGGVTIENIAANIGFFVGQCGKVGEMLEASGAGT